MADPMNVEPGTKPNPDPTVATNDAVERAMKSERDYVNGEIARLEERLHGIDRATELRLGGIEGIPGQIDEKVSHLASLVDERFNSTEKQFASRDEAVKAAFAAQEKQAIQESASNKEAINKSETATSETIKTNQELGASKTEGLTKSLDELKLQVSRIESTRQGAHDQKADTRSGSTFTQNMLVGGAVLVLTILNIIGIVYSSRTPATQPVVTVPASTTP